MRSDHVFDGHPDGRYPSREEIEAAIRRAHYERSVAVHEALRRAVAWIVAPLRPRRTHPAARRGAAAVQGC
jgi:hypothetical protein